MKNSENKNSTPPWKGNRSLHFSIGLVLSLTLITTAFEWNFRKDLTDRPIDSLSRNSISEIDLIVVDDPLPPRPKVPTALPPEPVALPVPTDDTEVEIDKTIEVPDPVDYSPNIDDLFGNNFFEEEEKDEVVYDLINAQPKGGMDSFYQYLYESIQYPEHLTSRNITGRIFVKFEVSKEGKIVNVEILKGFDKELEKEIIRVLTNSPAWEPAQLGMEKVRTQHQIPFTFHIR